MALSIRTRWRIRVAATIAATGGAVGGVISFLVGGGEAFVASALTGILNGGLLATMEMLLQSRWHAALRRVPLPAVLVLRVALYSTVFLGVNAVANAAAHAQGGREIPITPAVLTLSFLAAVAVNLFFIFRRLIGPQVFVALLSGRYRQPQREERIVLFLDLQGSTGLAERLGDLRFVAFLDAVFYDLRLPTTETGAEIYRYIGDEVILTWDVARGARNADCVTCLFRILDTLAARRADYEREFGAAPHLRCALHAGPVVVGEVGDVRREIVMLGDTMNTTARIEDVCRSSGHDVVASVDVLNLLALPANVRAESLGPVSLRGKAETLELFALSRAFAEPPASR